MCQILTTKMRMMSDHSISKDVKRMAPVSAIANRPMISGRFMQPARALRLSQHESLLPIPLAMSDCGTVTCLSSVTRVVPRQSHLQWSRPLHSMSTTMWTRDLSTFGRCWSPGHRQ